MAKTTRTSRSEILTLGAILTLAFFLRFYLITEIPPGLWPDEAVNGVNAVRALKTGNFKIFYPENNGREGLFINIQALAVKAFGVHPWSLRLVSAAFGTLTVLGLYFAAKELFEKKSEALSTKSETNPKKQISNTKHDDVLNLRHLNLFRNSNFEFRISSAEAIALLSAFFLATSFWHINFSRIGFRAIAVPFFASFGLYWLLKALRTGKISSMVLGGVFTGLGFHSYIAYRFMPFVLAVPIVIYFYHWMKKHIRDICVPCVIALYLFVTLVVALPIGLYFINNPSDFVGRSAPISVFADKNPLLAFAKSSVITLGMFNVVGDCNPRHNFFCRPELFWPVGLLFLVGVVVTVKRLFKKEKDREGSVPNRRSSVILISWFIFMLLPSTLTRESLPHALRSIGAIPPVFILSGLGAWWVWQWIQKSVITGLEKFINSDRSRGYLAARLNRIKKELFLLAMVFLLWVGVNEAVTYFIRWAPTPAVAGAFESAKTELAEYVMTVPPEIPVYVLVNEPSLLVNGVSLNAAPVVFLASARPNTFFITPGKLDRVGSSPAKTIAVALHTDHSLFSELKQRYPNGFTKVVTADITLFVLNGKNP